MAARGVRELGLADVIGEAAMLAGGGATILMQLADPAVAAGVARHSDFAERPVDRLNGTLDYVYATVYGDEELRRFVRRRVNRLHAPVRSSPAGSAERSESGSPDASPPYSAFDPALQLWVAATLFAGAVEVYETLIGHLDRASRERLCREFAAVGTGLQLPAELWPQSLDAFEAYWDERVAGLRVSDEAKTSARMLLRPPAAPRWLRALMPTVGLATAGFLPDRVRDQYGLPWGALQRRRFARLVRVVALVYPLVPRSLRFAVRDVHIRKLRRELGLEPRASETRAGH